MHMSPSANEVFVALPNATERFESWIGIVNMLIVDLVGLVKLVVVLVSEASISIESPPENPSPEVSSSSADASSTIASEAAASKASEPKPEPEPLVSFSLLGSDL